MAQKWDFWFQVPNGDRVGYSAFKRAGQISVAFIGTDGKRVERSTRLNKVNADWHAEAERCIKQHFTTLFTITNNISWDDALEQVKKAYPATRPKTVLGWTKAISTFREVMPEVASPCDVSEDRVKVFARKYLAMPSKRTRAGNTKRQPSTLSFYLRGLSAFSNHLVDLGLLAKNLFKGVPLPGVPGGKMKRKPVVAPAEDVVTKFFGWVHERYPEWKSLHALLELKATTGCRTADVCQLKTEHLAGGKLVFTADITKTNTARTVILPPDLFALVVDVAGKVWLWEKLFAEIPLYRKQSNGLPTSFNADTIYHIIGNIFREFSDTHPDLPRLTPHAFRRRALTRLTIATNGNTGFAANIIGVTRQTADRYYVDATQAFASEEAQRQYLGVLSPKMEGTE